MLKLLLMVMRVVVTMGLLVDYADDADDDDGDGDGDVYDDYGHGDSDDEKR